MPPTEFSMDLFKRALWSLVLYGLAIGIALLVVFVSQAWRVGFSGADESAHFLNGLFISDYLAHHLGEHPLNRAVEYYIHYPKLSIGHWPPAWYGVLGLLFLVIPVSSTSAILLNAAVAALPAALAGWIMLRFVPPVWAALGVALIALTPVAMESYVFFMADQILAASLLLATWLWVRYTLSFRWAPLLGFAVIGCFAILTKGNGWLLVFVPLLHLALTGTWLVLTRWQTYVGPVAIALAVIPWYLVTAGITGEGFDHQPGLRYAMSALTANLQVLATSIGATGLLFVFGGLLGAWLKRERAPEGWSVAAGVFALVLATLIFQSLVPAGILGRYLAPALPPLVTLAVLGAFSIAGWLQLRVKVRGTAVIFGALAILLIWPAALQLARIPVKTDFRFAEVMAMAEQPDISTLWMIDGTSGAEGGFIAEMAIRDPMLRHYVTRSSKVFAESDFLGKLYMLKFDSPEEIQRELTRLGVQGVVLVRPAGQPAFPHGDLLFTALERAAPTYRRVATLNHRNRPGETLVYIRQPPVPAAVDAIRRLGISGKAASLTGASP